MANTVTNNEVVITAVIKERLNKRQWINLLANGYLVSSTWGYAKITYCADCIHKYMLSIGPSRNNCTDSFLHVNKVYHGNIYDTALYR